MHIQEHDARGQRLAPFARPKAGSTADSTRGVLAAAQAGEIVALSVARPAALVASLSAALEAGAVPLVLPPGLPLEAARRVAAEVGARYLRW